MICAIMFLLPLLLQATFPKIAFHGLFSLSMIHALFVQLYQHPFKPCNVSTFMEFHQVFVCIIADTSGACDACQWGEVLYTWQQLSQELGI